MMLPRIAGIRHVREVRESKAHAKRKAAFLAAQWGRHLKRSADAGAALSEAVRETARVAGQAASSFDALGLILHAAAPRPESRSASP